MMLTEILKEKTLVNHQQLEKKLVGKMREMTSIYDYVLLLKLYHSYFGGLEKTICPYITLKILPDYEKRCKVSLILSDLQTLNSKVPITSSCDNLPLITNTAEALGALYVMEGSTLGGQIIKKIISKQLAIDETYAMSFFNGYGNNTNQMWAFFKVAIDQYSSPETDEMVINSANQTFRRFSDWF